MSQIHSFLASLTHRIKVLHITTPIAIILAAFIIGGSHIVYAFVVRSDTQQTQVALFRGKPIDNKDYIEGNTKSNVIIVEYSDPECPYCVSLHPTMKQIRNVYKDKVAFVYRHFPLTQIHPHAHDESKAIACAGMIGGSTSYYEYIDALYGYKSTNKTTQLPLTGKEDIAVNIGLDKTKFLTCMKEATTSTTVDAAISDGVQAGVQGTPSSFILIKTKKGYEVVSPIDGARPYEYIQASIEEALSR